MSTPFFDLIEELRALGGAPKVTYPTGNNNYPQTERTIKAKRGAQILALGSPEPDTVRFPNNILTEQIELRSDAQVVEVYRKYEVLPGPFTKQGQDYDPEYGLLAEYTEGEVKNGAAIGTATSDIEPLNYIKSNLKTYTVPTAALNSFYLTFPAKSDIDLPRVLAQLLVTWSLNTGTGSYSESGTGATAGTSGSLSLSAQGRGQGSASALGDITPVFAPKPSSNLPVLDYFFFLPNPVTLSAILTRASAIATALAGTTTTVNDWPIFAPQVHSFFVASSKVSVSCEAVARCSISFNLSGGGSESYSTSTGNGTNEDFGPNVKVVTLPESIHGPLGFTGATAVSQESSASAMAYLASGTNWPGAGSNSPTTLTTPASGFVTPTSVGPTPVPALPTSGLYLYKPDVAVYKWGYSTVRARIFDFSVISYAQVSLADFSPVIGSNYVTGAAGNGFVIPLLSGGAVGVWFNTGTETQPDFSASGVTSYVQVSISPTATSAQIATATATAFSGSPNWTAVVASFNANAVQFTALQKGLAPFAFDVTSGATISVLTPG